MDTMSVNEIPVPYIFIDPKYREPGDIYETVKADLLGQLREQNHRENRNRYGLPPIHS